jgi:acyl-CoA synthetase (AMP-forming)/AMP-acid ligase II
VPIDVTSLYNRRADNRWERVCVGDILERVTWSRPDQVAITGWPGAFGDPAYERLTYRQADEVANRFANGLLAGGLDRGDRVLLVCENSVEAYLAKIATAKAGLVAVPVNPALAPDVLAYLIQLADPRFVIVDAELWPGAAQVIGAVGLRPDVTIPIGGGVAPGGVSFAEFVAAQPATEPDAVVHGDDIWEILFTSGTTAMPKGVMLSHSYAYMGAMSFALSLTRGLRIEADLKLCSFLPVIYHVADEVLSLPAFLAGGSLVIGRKPVPAQMAAAIAAERVTALWGGSPQLVKALAAELDAGDAQHEARADDLDARSLQVLVYGWGAVEPAVRSRLQQLCGDQFILVGIFGQTEAISCHRFWPDVWEDTYQATAPQLNYVGIPNPLLGSTVMDPDGQHLLDQPGVPGEAVYRSPAVAAGYYQDPEATQHAFRHGWFHSGDSCMVDEDGLRIMVDRYKDIIKSGGENVSSLRVEAVLHQHPEVAKAAVIGLGHDRWGEAVTAIVVSQPGRQPGAFEAGQFEAGQFEAELIAFCRERLAGFETPKAVVVVEALPETVGGKVLKYKLREQFAGHFQAAVGPDPGSIDSPDNRVRLCVVDRQDPAPLTLHSRRGRCP